MPTKKLGEMSKDELIRAIQQLKKRKKYGIVWEEKQEDVVEKCKTDLPVLQEVSERTIQENPKGNTNLIIDGDNYHSLSVLNYTHAGKVDIIYIDPPYNTGGADFRYNDKTVDKTDTFRHSKWLAHLSKRLHIA